MCYNGQKEVIRLSLYGNEVTRNLDEQSCRYRGPNLNSTHPFVLNTKNRFPCVLNWAQRAILRWAQSNWDDSARVQY